MTATHKIENNNEITFSITGTYTEPGNTNSTTLLGTKTLYPYWTSYIGYNTSDELKSVSNLTNIHSRTLSGTQVINIPENMAAYIYLVTASASTFTFKSGGLDFIVDDPYTVTINSTTYYFYRSSNKLTGNWTIVIT